MRTHLFFHGIRSVVLFALVGAGLLQSQSPNVATADAKVSIGFQNSGGASVGTAVSISFQSSGGATVGRGVSIAFQNASSNVGRGVSIALGSYVPPATQITGAYGQSGTTRNPSGSFGEPVNTATGNYYANTLDLTAAGRGLSFAFGRSYNSADPYSGPLGVGWTHSFNLVLTENPDASVSVKEGDGGAIAFAPAGGGSYTPAMKGVFDNLKKNGDGSFTLTRKNQTRVNFSSQGRLASIVDRNGNAQTFAYNGSGNLSTIIDSASRSFTLAYDGNNRLEIGRASCRERV